MGKESLENNVFKELEPTDYYEKHGLFIWGKRRPVVKNEIDRAIKKVEERLKNGRSN